MAKIWLKVQDIAPYLFQSGGFSSRKQFLFSYFAILGVIGLVNTGVLLATGGNITDDALQGLTLLLYGWALIPAIRRCHDLGWSGWASLLLYVPFAFVVLLLLLAFKKGYVWNPAATVEEELKTNLVPRKRMGPRSRPMR